MDKITGTVYEKKFILEIIPFLYLTIFPEAPSSASNVPAEVC